MKLNEPEQEEIATKTSTPFSFRMLTTVVVLIIWFEALCKKSKKFQIFEKVLQKFQQTSSLSLEDEAGGEACTRQPAHARSCSRAAACTRSDFSYFFFIFATCDFVCLPFWASTKAFLALCACCPFFGSYLTMFFLLFWQLQSSFFLCVCVCVGL